MPQDSQFDVYLCHSSKDKAIVRPLAEQLRNDGLRVWFDEWEIKRGDNIPAKIEEGLEHSRLLVLCMSANAFGSDWAELESQTGFAQKVILALFASASPPDVLRLRRRM
ncbi:MAG TPA: toll/interleukin-1 receptor domain-containing protein [Pyrinomonadaceae bacterium]